MFNYTTIKNVIGRDVALSQTMIDAINEWKKMQNGMASWTNEETKSLRIEEGICREFADAVVVEMEANIPNNDRLDKVFQKSLAELNENLQDGLALGSFVLRPLGAEKYEYITADKLIPISFDDSGKPNDIAFLSVKSIGESNYYTRVERHYFMSGNLTVENWCYHSQTKGDIGQRCNLKEIEEWSNINPGPVTYLGMTQMDFGYYRNPLKNKVDGSSCGVSIYESAKELIKKADIQVARLDWEYDSGERVIHVDDRALRKKGSAAYMPKLKKRLYRGLNLEDGKDKELYKEYSPDMRDEAYIRGLEKYYRTIEFTVGLAYGDLSETNEVNKTATEVKVSKIRKYNRVNAIQQNLEECLQDFVTGLAFYNGSYNSGVELTCTFNDSILTDEETERAQDRQDVSMGVMSLAEYRAKWYNEDIDTAQANLPEQNTVIDDSVKVSDPKVGAEVQGKQLNGAQTQSLIAIMSQYSSGDLTEGQAINLIATAIGIEKEEARKLLNGDVI